MRIIENTHKERSITEYYQRFPVGKDCSVGGFCLDAYWFIDESKSEVSIETRKLTRLVKQQRYTQGEALATIHW